MSLAICTVVDKEYMSYLPLFVYCLNKAYPDYHCRLFLRDPCPYDLKTWKLKCEIIDMFEDYPRWKYLSIALRFAIDKKYFEDFDFAFITDIDIMIMRQDVSLEYFHRLEMEDTGLCYSNSIRNASHYAGSQSLTGLHFASKEWFERTNDIAMEYRDLMRNGLVGLYREYDGCMLYRVAERSGVGLPGKYKLAARHHGAHLGSFRLFGKDRYKLDVRIPMHYRTQWLTHCGNGIFQDIMATCRKYNSELDSQLTQLDNFIMRIL